MVYEFCGRATSVNCSGWADASTGHSSWQGRLTGFAGNVLTLDLSAVKQKGKAKKAVAAPVVEIPLANVEKAQLVAEI